MLASLSRTHWRLTRWSTPSEKSQYSNASCARPHADVKQIWGFTFKSFTPATFPLNVNAATATFQIVTATRFMQRLTRARNAIAVNSALTLLSRPDTWSRTCWSIPIRSLTSAISVSRLSAKSNCWSGMRTFITTRITLPSRLVKRTITARLVTKLSVIKET